MYNSFGTVWQAGGYSLTVNAGEPLSRGFFQISQNRVLTEGFIQPEKDGSLGLSESAGETAGFSVWPNPATEGITVAFPPDGKVKRTASVYDIAGKCLSTETLCTGCTSQYLPLYGLADGMYVLRVLENGSRAQEFRFIKISR